MLPIPPRELAWLGKVVLTAAGWMAEAVRGALVVQVVQVVQVVPEVRRVQRRAAAIR
jgi:hypothetical protein